MMKWILSALVIISSFSSFARDYFVGGAGASDSNPGTAAQPFATIQRAATVAVAGDVVLVRAGTYRETVVPANSGVTFQNDNGAVVTVSGLNVLTTPWTSHSGQIYKTTVTLPVNGFASTITSNTTLLANQIFKDGVMQFQARWPKISTLNDLLDRDKFRHHSQMQGFGQTSLTDAGLPAVNLTGASLFVTGWFISQTRTITSDNGNTLSYSALDQNPKFQRWYYVTNDLELLTQAKEWHYEGGVLYFWQDGGGSPTNVEYKARNWGFDLRGKDNVKIIGLHFKGCEPATGDTGTDGTVIDNIRATYMNHAFMQVDPDQIYNSPKQTGIKLLGNNNTVRNSEFKYAASQVIWAGPGTIVENNLCSDISYEGNYGAFVTPYPGAGNIKILRNTVSRVGRSAVDFGYDGDGNHHNMEIAYNNFHTYLMLNSDGGCLYAARGIRLNGTRIHHNWIHDNVVGDRWSGSAGAANYDGIHVNIYFDQGTGPTTVDHNVLWNGGVADYYSQVINTTQNIYNNTFAHTGQRESYIVAQSAPHDVLRNNLFVNTVNINWGGSVGNIANCIMPTYHAAGGSWPIAGTNIFSNSPTFVGPLQTGLGYRLQNNSPAVNAGVIIPGITDGSVGAPDIGAYEYGGTEWVPGYRAVTTTPSPNTSPVVSITAPANNSSVAQGTPITIAATATDADGTVARVEFFNGTTKLGEDTSSPYSFAWNNAPAGTHSLTARATDNDNGVTTSTAINLTVTANAAPTVSITAPANNATIVAGNPINITATAADANGTVTLVEFFDGTTKLGEDAASPYSFTWNNASAGTHTLTARATNNANNTTTSTVVTITVGTANTAPLAALTSPANNAQFTVGSAITITATASDANGSVTKVEFFDGATKLGEDLSSPYSFAWSNATAGTHILTVRATDNGNVTTTSTSVTITVGAANSPPVVALTSPANNAQFAAGASITITATASDANGTVSKVEFFNGTTKLGEDLTSPYSFAWNNAVAGTHTLTARATDNAALITTSAAVTITVAALNAPPVVTLTGPSNNAQFSSGSPVTITANASDPNGSVTKVEFFSGSTKLGEDLTSPYTFAWSNATDGTHVLTARATDNGNLTSTSTAITVSFGSNGIPVVSINSPLNNAQFIQGSTITITATASKVSGSVSKVEFFNGTTKLGEDLSSPYSFIWTNVSSGNYILSARATDNLGGIASSALVNISVTDPAGPIVEAGENMFLTLPENSLTLNPSVESDVAVDYNWSQIEGPNTASLSNPNTEDINVSDLIAGTYVFELSVTNANGVTTIDRVTITVVAGDISGPQASQSGIPRFFSPNDDGNGDYWEWSEIESFENSLLTVYNRSGQKIYETVSYDNTWDGKMGGEPLQPGDYYYVIQLADASDIKGSVRIIR